MHVHIATSQFNGSETKAQPEWTRQIFIPLLVANGIVGVRDMGGDLRLANLNDDLQTLFELTKLDTLFQISETRERALESF